MQDDIIFNRAELTSRLGGDKKTTDEILAIFAEELRELLQLLQDAIDKYDYPSIHSVAHTMKGAAANVGAISLAGHAAKIIKAADDKLNFEIDQILDNLLIDAATVISMIKTKV
ncbi:MAG: Hpt domain-containing protein [bacterium]